MYMENRSKLVTILTVVYNGEKTISRTMDSVLNQTYGNIEYIVIDGLSQDGTLEIVRSYQERFDRIPGRFLRIVSEKDKGMYDALNKGARMARGELVGQINADDWYEPNAVEIMAAMYMREAYDVAWGNIRIKARLGDIVKKAKIGRIWTTSGFCHPAMFSRRSILVQYPYALESMYDDFDFITQARQKGLRLRVINEVISCFSTTGMSMQRNKGIKEVFRRTNVTYRIYRKYGMSRLYYFPKLAMEFAKYLMGDD